MFTKTTLTTLCLAAAITLAPAVARAAPVTLRPQQQWGTWWENPKSGDYDRCAQSGRTFAKPEKRTPGAGLVGYNHFADPINGCGPKSFANRTRPQFDVTQFHTIHTATLTWNEHVRVARSEDGVADTGAGMTCTTRVLIGSYAPGTPNTFFSGDPFSSNIRGAGETRSVDVTKAVRNWIYGHRANQGFVLAADYERVTGDDGACVADVSQFHLTVS